MTSALQIRAKMEVYVTLAEAIHSTANARGITLANSARTSMMDVIQIHAEMVDYVIQEKANLHFANVRAITSVISARQNRMIQIQIQIQMPVIPIPAKMMEFAFHKMMEQFSANAKKATKANIVIKSDVSRTP